jgi:MFS-type transporter involved in bile tolerance (Atg22 family)
MTRNNTNGTAPQDRGALSASNSSAPPNIERKLSISEQASAASSRRIASPPFLKWIEYPFRIKNPNTQAYLEEATGQAMDYAGRGPINQAGSFVGSAVLTLAAMEAGGINETIHGIKVSSLLTLGNLIAGVTAGVTMPFVGALVDHTDHRKAMGALSAIIVLGGAGAQLMLSANTWFVVYILGIIIGYFFIMHQVCVMAYLPDLTHNITEMGHYTAMFMTRQYFVQGVYTTIIVVSSFTAKINNISTAKLGIGLAFAIGTICFGYAWLFLFRKRPRLREVPQGQNLVSTGFVQLWSTTKVVFSQYHALKWFMIALLWSPEAGAGTILAIAVTFLTLFVKMTVSEISLVSLCMLFANIPGAILSRYMCKKINPLNSFRAAEILFAVSNALIAATVTGPEKKKLVYIYAAMIGVAFGWMFPSQRTTVVALVPKGQETEIMGLISFFGQIIGWLPSFIFTLMNQNGVNMRWGIGMVSFFLLTSFLCTLMCGDFNKAVESVSHTSEAYLQEFARRSSVKNSFMNDENGGLNVSTTNGQGKATDVLPQVDDEEVEEEMA